MYGARIVEMGTTDAIYTRPEMPYTLGLLSSIPRMDKEVGGRLEPIPGNPPSPIHLPPGCVFEPRCRYASMTNGLSETVRPELSESEPGHFVRCHLPPEVRRQHRARRARRAEREDCMSAANEDAKPAVTSSDGHLVTVRDLHTYFPVRSRGLLPRTVGQVKAVDGIDLTIDPGETLGLVGESGSGKTTAARSILMLVKPTSGSIKIDGEEITEPATKGS